MPTCPKCWYTDNLNSFRYCPLCGFDICSGYSTALHPARVSPTALLGERCVKCGSTDIRVMFHTDDASWSSYHNTHRGEHLHYVCQHCNYDWTRYCLDAKEPPPGPEEVSDAKD